MSFHCYFFFQEEKNKDIEIDENSQMILDKIQATGMLEFVDNVPVFRESFDLFILLHVNGFNPKLTVDSGISMKPDPPYSSNSF